VLQAARPPPAEGRLVAALQAEVEALQERLAGAQRGHEHALRALQQQYEQLKARAAGERERERLEVGVLPVCDEGVGEWHRAARHRRAGQMGFVRVVSVCSHVS
jgi:hypothetical protein